MRHPKIILEGDTRVTALPHLERKGDAEVAVVGWREWAALPGLGIAGIEAKIDTGARTSALHANSIEPFDKGGRTFVRFDVIGEAESAPWHEAAIAARRAVRSSNGEAELRYVIRTDLLLAGRTSAVEVTLTNRERMESPMLIGREALAGRVLVDADRSWLCGKPVWRRGKAHRAALPGLRLRRGDPV